MITYKLQIVNRAIWFYIYHNSSSCRRYDGKVEYRYIPVRCWCAPSNILSKGNKGFHFSNDII